MRWRVQIISAPTFLYAPSTGAAVPCRIMAESFSILGIPSTLRAASFNTGLLRAAREVAPDGVTVNIYPIQVLPFYDQDAEATAELPMVRDFRDQVRAADALLLATAEY